MRVFLGFDLNADFTWVHSVPCEDLSAQRILGN